MGMLSHAMNTSFASEENAAAMASLRLIFLSLVALYLPFSVVFFLVEWSSELFYYFPLFPGMAAWIPLGMLFKLPPSLGWSLLLAVVLCSASIFTVLRFRGKSWRALGCIAVFSSLLVPVVVGIFRA